MSGATENGTELTTDEVDILILAALKLYGIDAPLPPRMRSLDPDEWEALVRLLVKDGQIDPEGT